MDKDLIFEYVEDFTNYIVERVENNEELFLTVVGRFEEIKNIIKEMMVIADVDFEKIILSCPEVSDYIDEYVLDCWCDDGVIQIGCELAKRDGKYLNSCGDETYLFEDCSSKIIPLCEGLKLYFVSIENERSCDCECSCDCHKENVAFEYSKGADGNLHGFTASKVDDNKYQSYSFYTSEKLNESNIRDLLEEFGF